ncbi:MAG: hypothetical protein HY760_00375 [Nitrospirae bacterium]|nr:hypothetical protein [Nitrospirota bacterium]
MIGAVQPVSQADPVTILKNAKADLNVDGFFTAIPKGARVFLRSSVSGQPVMVYYRLGKGAVLASTLFTDWALTHQRATREEVALFGRILEWALSPSRLPNAERGGEEDRNPLPPLTFAVLSDHESYTLGSTAVFTITVWNNDNRQRTVNVYYDRHGETLPILPRRSARITYSAKVHSSHRLWVYFHDENGRFLQTLTRGIEVLFTPPLETSLRVEKEIRTAGTGGAEVTELHPGDPVRISLGLSGSGYPKDRAEVHLKVFDPDHRLIHGETVTALLAGPSNSFSREIRFVLPADAVGGDYLVSAEAVDKEGEKVGGESITFELPLSLISVTPELPEAVLPKKKADVAFILNNLGKTAVEKGGLALQIQDPAGRKLYEASLPFALKQGESRTLRFPVTFPEILLGDYALLVTQSDETRRGVPVPTELSGGISARPLWNQAVYRVRDTVELSLKIANAGPFEMDRLQVTVAVPDLLIRETQESPLSAHGEDTVFFRLPIPEAASPGTHEVTVTFAAADSTVTRTFSVEIPPSSLSVLSKQPAYRPGEKILVTLSNAGGVDTEAETRLALLNLQGNAAAESTNTIPVAAGENQPVYLTIPQGTAPGKYRLEIGYTDVKTHQTKQAQQNIQIVK